MVSGRLPIEHVVLVIRREVKFFGGPLLGRGIGGLMGSSGRGGWLVGSSRDWAGAGGDGAWLGVDPRGDSDVLPLDCSAGAAGVVAVLVVVVWLDTGIIGGDAGGVWLRSAVAVGSAGDGGAESSALASASGTGLAGGFPCHSCRGCQLVGEIFSHVDFETRHDSVYQQQPRSIHCLIVGCGQEVSLHECVPQLGFRQQTLAAD
ncbi:hypothetical protein GQ457_16G012060 [Hibiscus cannabinus]